MSPGGALRSRTGCSWSWSWELRSQPVFQFERVADERRSCLSGEVLSCLVMPMLLLALRGILPRLRAALAEAMSVYA